MAEVVHIARTNEQYEIGGTNLLWDIEVKNNSDTEPGEPYYDLCSEVYLYDFYSSSAPRPKELPAGWTMSSAETARTNYWTVDLHIINDMFLDYAIQPGYSMTFSILSSMSVSNSHIFIGTSQGQGKLYNYGLQPVSEFQGPTGAVPPAIVMLTNVIGAVTTSWAATEFELSGTASAETIGTLTWTNELSGAWGELPAVSNWQFIATNLLTGLNRIVVKGTSSYSVSTAEARLLRPPRFWIFGPTSLLETATGRYECAWQDTNVTLAATWSLIVTNPLGTRLYGTTLRAGILPEGSNSQTARIRVDYQVEGMDTNAELDVEVQTIPFTSWIPATGLVGFWPLDGDARDLSPVANSGVVHGALTYLPGRFGQAGQFDQRGTKFIEVAHHPAYVFSNAFTISYWYQCTNGIYGRILQKHFPLQTDNGNCWEWMTEAGNNVNFSYAWPGGGGNYDVLRTGTVQTNWTHYLVTYTTNDNLLRIYIDGTERTNKTPVTTLLPMTTTLSLTFMFDRVSAIYDAEGLLDDVAMWDRALSSNEVAKVFAGAKPPLLWVAGIPESGGSIPPYSYGPTYLDALPMATITAQAMPALDYGFTSWSGDVVSADNPIALVVSTSHYLTARFSVTNPVVGPVTLWRATNQLLKATDLMLLTNSADAHGSPLTVAWISPSSTNSGTLTLTNHWVTYTPPAGNDTPDYFMFRIQNTNGTSVEGMAEVIVITPAIEGQTMNISSVAPSTSNTVVRFIGIPGRAYDVQSTTNLVSTPWVKIGDITIGGMGYVIFTDTNEPAGQFYRTARPE